MGIAKESMEPLLRVEGLSKRYAPPPTWARPLMKVASRSPVDALRDVTFQVDAGQVMGLVGPNGAGKSTLIRLIAGLLEPTSGRVLVSGQPVSGDGPTPTTGLGLVLEGDRGLYSRLTGVQNLEFFGVMAGLNRVAAHQRALELMESFDLSARDKLVFGYSAGMRMRLSLARALMANPLLVLLDEPTRSLDPVASSQASSLFRKLAADGHGVIVSNHRLDEVVAVCDRVVALVDGRIRFDGAPSELESADSGAQAALVALLADKSQT
ncbi:MAG: ABC transporter ATP-binding protein [Acidimicrobiia bacterium]